MEYLAAYIIFGIILYFVFTSKWFMTVVKDVASKKEYEEFQSWGKRKNKFLILCVTLGGLATALVLAGTVVKWLLGLFNGKSK